jgi:hypothetical protein
MCLQSDIKTFRFGVHVSLIATIKAARSDLLQNVTTMALPISFELPSQLQKPSEFIAGVGEPTNACFLSEAEIDPTGW